jgi:hypothetical protein
MTRIRPRTRPYMSRTCTAAARECALARRVVRLFDFG